MIPYIFRKNPGLWAAVLAVVLAGCSNMLEDLKLRGGPQLTADEAVNADTDSLTIAGFAFASGDSATNVNQNFTVPTSGDHGTVITWTATPPGVAVIGVNGLAAITRPGSDTVVTLTATITKDGISKTKVFTLTVKAYWSYTVTFDSQSATVAASPGSVTVVSPATTVGTLPTPPTRTGFIFGGWWTGTSGSGTQFTSSTPVTGTLTVYAKWTAPVTRNWWTITSSADGSILYAGERSTQKIYRSTDSGVTWTAVLTVAGMTVTSLSCSADGTKVIAAFYNDYLYVSTDTGANWTTRMADTPRTWNAVWYAPDGLSVWAGLVPGYLYRSTDDGLNWTEQTSLNTRNWYGLAGNTTGSRLLALHAASGFFRTTDSASTWETLTSPAFNNWAGLAGSSNGLKLVAINQGADPYGGIWTSSDGGSNWTRAKSTSSVNWRGVASSGDGTILVAAAYGGTLWTSADSGATWTERDATTRNWLACAASSDGTKLLAVAYGGQIWRSTDSGVTWSIVF